MKKATDNNVKLQTKSKTETSSGPSTDAASAKKTMTEKHGHKDKATGKAKEKTSPQKKTSRENTGKRNGRGILTGFIFLVALSATGLAAYDYILLNAQMPVNAQLINVQDSFKTRINQLEQQLQNTKNQLATDAQARSNAQSERSAINSALQGINEKLGRSTIAWRMAEVEYLLTVANHRLSLAHDRQTAIAIFETADSRLKAIADPALLKVRKKIASELTALRAMPNADIPGIVVQIGSLAERVNQLPLMDKKRLAIATEKQNNEEPKDWQEIPTQVWNDIKSLVQVRRHQQPTEPLLPPKQTWFLYQNLQLKLEQARLAALRQNTALFVQSLEEVSQWLDGYFEVESASVISMQDTVKKLSALELQPPVPDVSGSLRDLRAVMSARANMKISFASKHLFKETNAEAVVEATIL